MQALDGTIANPGGSLSATSESEIIGALRNIFVRSRIIISVDLETPYSCRFATTNDSVIELKDQSISAIINERQEQLDSASREISELETVMDSIKNHRRQLIEKKDKITQSMKFHKRLVSAVCRLPTEVLSHIFVHCLPETSYILPVASKSLTPMLLTRICRRWREVAVGMPSLWCRVWFCSTEVDNRHWESMAFCYDLWLKRSRGLPLSLEAWCDEDDSITKLRGVIQPYINQISSLYIHFVFQASKPELVFKDLPALQELTVCAYDFSKMRRIAQSMSQLLHTMHSLKVTFPLFNLEDFSASTPLLARLTNIEVAINQLNAVPQLLHLCPNLSSLTIHAGVEQQIQTIEPFTHTKLRSLRIAHDLRNTEHLFGLLNALSLPDLRLLEARYIGSFQQHILFDTLPPPKLCELEARYAQPWPHEGLKALLARSNFPLESLVFGGGAMTTDVQRAEYVALIPCLQVVVDPIYQDVFA